MYDIRKLAPEDRETSERQLGKAQEQKRQMQELLDDSNFKFLLEILQKQIDGRVNDVLMAMPSGVDNVVQNTFTSGEIAGIKVAMLMPQLLIDAAESTIVAMKALRNQEQELKEHDRHDEWDLRE